MKIHHEYYYRARKVLQMELVERTHISAAIGSILGCFCVVVGFLLSTHSEILSLIWPAIAPIISSPSTILPIRFTSLLQPDWEAVTSASLSVLTAIPKARTLIQAEQKRTATEQNAFERFRRHVATLETPSTTDNTHKLQATPQPIKATSPSSTSDSLETIQRAYRDTVMSISHYEEEYGEPLEQNLALEFGEELAVAVTTNSRLTWYLQQSIIQAADEAATRRKRFIPKLQTEADALEDAERTVSKIQIEYEALTGQPYSDQSADDLRETHRQLTKCRTNCEDILNERQTQRADGHMAEPRASEFVDLHEYLYQPLDVMYPVLSDTMTVLDRVETACTRVEESLIGRL